MSVQHATFTRSPVAPMTATLLLGDESAGAVGHCSTQTLEHFTASPKTVRFFP